MTIDEPDIPIEIMKKGAEHYEKGKLAMSIAEYQKAIDSFLEMMRLTFDDAVVWGDIAECYLLMDDRENCIIALRRAIELDPEGAELHHNLAMILIDIDLKEAEKFASKSVELDATLSNCWMTLGRVYYLTNRPVEAMKVLGTSIGLANDNAEAFYLLGRVFAVLIQYDKAERSFVKALQLFPERSEYLKTFGTFLLRRGRIEEARNYLLKAHDADPYDHTILTDLAETIIELQKDKRKESDPDQVGEAMEYLNKSLELAVDYGKTWYHWGEIQLMLRNFKEGEKFFRAAIENGFDVAEAYLWLAGCLHKLGREKEANEMLDEYNKRRPHIDEGMYG